MTISLFSSNSILSPYSTRTINNTSMLYFESLTALKIATIDAYQFEQLRLEYLDVREFGNKVLQNELLQKVKKETGMASLAAKERLLDFREQYPMFENLIPHTVIASYLGITNISLSRLRRELAS